MGIYSDYLDRQMGFEELARERKAWLKRISDLRDGHDILVYAGDVNKRAPISIDNSDIIPFTDLLGDLKGSDAIDIIIQTPGGIADVVERFVNLLRGKYKNVSVIVPGMAMSAGTIFSMSADEILMGKSSSLGPIDAQIMWNGKQYSAGAFLDGLDKIKEDIVKNNGRLNPIYIPILQGISPGEIQHNENAQELSASLVRDWLVKYKFSHWTTHSSSGAPVTLDEKKKRARDIAEKLGKNSHWLTHSRPLGIKELRDLKLLITDYTEIPELDDAISRYFILLSMTFDNSGIYKVYETIDKQIYRSLQAPTNVPAVAPGVAPPPDKVMIDYVCPKCGTHLSIQGNLKAGIPLEKGAIPFPANNVIICPKCRTTQNVQRLRMDIEAQLKRKIV